MDSCPERRRGRRMGPSKEEAHMYIGGGLLLVIIVIILLIWVL